MAETQTKSKKEIHMQDDRFIPTPIRDVTVDVKTSQQVNELFDAIARAKAKFPVIEKTRVAEVPMKSGGKYSYSYADLADINSAITKPLSEEGLAVLQPMGVINGDHFVLTLITHKSGQWLQSSYRIDIDPDMGEQIKGSAITYSRRYALCATLGIVAEEDDDGAAAQKSKGSKVSGDDANSKKPVTEPQVKRLFAIMNTRVVEGWDKSHMEEIAIAAFGLKESIMELNMGQYRKLCEWIEKMTYQQTHEKVQAYLKEKETKK